jgi:hypothetical protein
MYKGVFGKILRAANLKLCKGTCWHNIAKFCLAKITHCTVHILFCIHVGYHGKGYFVMGFAKKYFVLGFAKKYFVMGFANRQIMLYLSRILTLE